MQQRIKKIYEYFGFDDQLEKYKEELLELMTAMQKYKNDLNRTTFAAVIGEIADVSLLEKQLEYAAKEEKEKLERVMAKYFMLFDEYSYLFEYIVLNHKDRIDAKMECKIDRTLLRMAGGYYM